MSWRANPEAGHEQSRIDSRSWVSVATNPPEARGDARGERKACRAGAEDGTIDKRPLLKETSPDTKPTSSPLSVPNVDLNHALCSALGSVFQS